MSSQNRRPTGLRGRITDRSANLLTGKPALILAIVAAGLMLLQMAGQARDPIADEPGQSSEIPPVRVATARELTEPGTLRLPGVLRARNRSDLAFLHAGQLVERRALRGQRVSAGDILALLHNPSLMPGADAAAAQAREAQLNLDQLEREVARLADLHARSLVPTEELERIRARRDAAGEALRQAQASLNEAREQLDEATLRAPFDAQVSRWHAEPGQFVAAGQPIVALTGQGDLEVAIHLPQDASARLRVGQRARLIARNGAQQGEAIISELGSAAPGRPAELILSLSLELNELKPGADSSIPDRNDSQEAAQHSPQQASWQSGQAVDVVLTLDERPLLAVPLAALVQSTSGAARVFRVANDRALAVDVSPGQLRGDWVVVEGPLTAGDAVIVAGQSRLLDDDQVRVLP